MTAAGALGIPWVVSFANLTGWADVGATFLASAIAPMASKMIGMGGGAAEEVMKGGIAAGFIKAAHQLGFLKGSSLGLYAPSWFGVPTASSQYLRAYNANIGPAPRGQGTLYVPAGTGGALVPAVVAPVGPGGAPVAVPAAGPPGGGGMGYHRFRSRYAGNY